MQPNLADSTAVLKSISFRVSPFTGFQCGFSNRERTALEATRAALTEGDCKVPGDGMLK